MSLNLIIKPRAEGGLTIRVDSEAFSVEDLIIQDYVISEMREESSEVLESPGTFEEFCSDKKEKTRKGEIRFCGSINGLVCEVKFYDRNADETYSFVRVVPWDIIDPVIQTSMMLQEEGIAKVKYD